MANKAFTLIVGADMGHSAAKVLWATNHAPEVHNQILIPTVVIPYFKITNDESAALGEASKVTLGENSYFYGNFALTQKTQEDYSGKEKDWITQSHTHDVMLVGAVQKAMEQAVRANGGYPEKVILVLGLPTDYYQSQRDFLKGRATELLRETQVIPESVHLIVGVKAQSEAPIYMMSFNQTGQPANSMLDTESYGIIEVGHYTIDFSLFFNKQMVTAQGGSIPEGVHTIYEAVRTEFLNRNIPVPLETLERAIHTGEVKIRGKVTNVKDIIDSSSENIALAAKEKMRSLFGTRLDTLDWILIAGGGAKFVYPSIVTEYENARLVEGPEWVDNSRWAVAEGLLRIGLYNAIKTA